MNKKPLIMVSGSNGQLGKELKKIAKAQMAFDFVFLSREDMPIHHFEMVRHYFKVYQPAFFINCAAYTAVDRAEQEKEKAYQVNAEAVGVLAAVCKENQCRFIHISTDYVFDGFASVPYREESDTNPQSVYGLRSWREKFRHCSIMLILSLFALHGFIVNTGIIL
jgi:dTDP-4-dehydrorhamnose reductase